ncbi:hypothetical protein NKH77_16760 [Streptomyces sp. M19]
MIVTSHGPLHDFEAGAAVDLALPPLDEGRPRSCWRRSSVTTGWPRTRRRRGP